MMEIGKIIRIQGYYEFLKKALIQKSLHLCYRVVNAPASEISFQIFMSEYLGKLLTEGFF